MNNNIKYITSLRINQCDDISFDSSDSIANSVNITSRTWYLDGIYKPLLDNKVIVVIHASELSIGEHTMELVITNDCGSSDQYSKSFNVNKAKCNVTIRTNPTGAKIFNGDIHIATTPAILSFEYEVLEKLTLKKFGYEDKQIEFTPTLCNDFERNYTMTPIQTCDLPIAMFSISN